MIYVTHDQVEAMTLADRIVVLRAGRIEQIGTPLDLYNTPANLFVAGFIGAPRMNLLPVKVRSAKADEIVVEGSSGVGATLAGDSARLQPGDDATLGIRPHHIAISGDGQDGVEAQVTLVEALGSETVVHMEIAGNQKLIAVLSGQRLETKGGAIRLHLDPERTHLFDRSGLRVSSVQSVGR